MSEPNLITDSKPTTEASSTTSDSSNLNTGNQPSSDSTAMDNSLYSMGWSSTTSMTAASYNDNAVKNGIPTNTFANANMAGGEQKVKREIDKKTVLAVLQLLKKNNLRDTENVLLKEAGLNISEEELRTLFSAAGELNETNVSNVLSNYNSEADADIYEDNYNSLKKFVESSLDSYRPELIMLLYPVFVHMYLELVYNEHEQQAISFVQKFGPEQEEYYQSDIKKLSMVTKKEQMKGGNELIDSFKNEQNIFTLRLSRDSYNYLKRFLQNKSKSNCSIAQKIIHENLYLDVYDGITRSKQQVESAAGGMMGEAKREANKAKVFYGLFKEPELKIQLPDEELDDSIAGEGEEKPKKKKVKKDTTQAKKVRNDPNAPNISRIPIPELRDAEQIDKARARQESLRMLKVGSDTLPSICFYTLLNSSHNQNNAALCAEIAEDSSLLAVGFSESVIRVWSLTPQKLKVMKSASDLELIEKDVDDVLYRMMDDKNTFDSKTLHGHSGPVYSVVFSPDRTLLLSCSEDATIRLWSLQTWTNICCYKGHCFPVWDVKFSPHGYYFASCGHDRTARLWATDQHTALRVLAGHISDVDCVQFHPNSNYIATGSTDRSVRLWDVLNGQCVRYLTGHKGIIYALTFENSGRFLASSGADKRILFWDIATGHLIAEFSGHTDTVYYISFSRGAEGAIMATGGIDDCINLWDIQKLIDDIDLEELNISHTPIVRGNSESLLLGSYCTKSASILATHFTRRNLLLGVGIFH